jgi:hypothetical protein
LGIALHSGDDPVFFNDTATEELFPYPPQTSMAIPQGFGLGRVEPKLIDSEKLGITHAELGKTWDTMQGFCSLINYAAESGLKIPQQLFLDVMASTLYRLVGMKFPIDSLHEAVRLGLSAFCSHVFIQWSNARLPHCHFPSVYRQCVTEHLVLSRPDMASFFLLPWLLMVGAMAVFPEGDAWLQPWLRRATGTSDPVAVISWVEVRATMKRLLWVDFVHDRCGGAIYRSVVHRHVQPV